MITIVSNEQTINIEQLKYKLSINLIVIGEYMSLIDHDHDVLLLLQIFILMIFFIQCVFF